MSEKKARSQPQRPSTLTGGTLIGKVEMDDGASPHQYRVEDFYCAASDKHHRGKKARWETGSMPPPVVARILSYVERDDTPYKSVPDFMRDAARHRLAYLESLEGRIDGPWVHASELERLHEDMKWQAAQVKAFDEQLVDANRYEDYATLRELLKEGQALARHLRSPFKEQVVEKVRGMTVILEKTTGDGNGHQQ